MNLENVVKTDCVTILTGVTIARVKQVRVFVVLRSQHECYHRRASVFQISFLMMVS